jgi:hypothetical protein
MVFKNCTKKQDSVVEDIQMEREIKQHCTQHKPARALEEKS